MPRITVGVRIKPEDESSIIKNFGHKNKADGEGGTIEISANGSKHDFLFDHIFSAEAKQEDVFRKCARPVVDSVLDGFNGTLFAYGQTGAGKTHTVMGPPVETEQERGLVLRAIEHLFWAAHRPHRTTAVNYIFKLSVIEIYNDTVIDLLREATSEVGGMGQGVAPPKVVVMDTPGGVVMPGLHLHPLDSAEEARSKVSEASLNRAVAEHQLNRRSSRSHAIYTFYVTQPRVLPSPSAAGDEGVTEEEQEGGAEGVMESKLHLVDLAGSERIEKSGSTGGLVKEATHINKSLSFLEQVVLALSKRGPGGGKGVVAYRQSKLTYILKDSLGGNCNTLLLGCVWPHREHVWETLSTLRFATRMKCIENHPSRCSTLGGGGGGSNRSLQVTIEALKRELAMRDAIHSHMRGAPRSTGSVSGGGAYTEALTKQQQADSVAIACAFACQKPGSNDNISFGSVAQAGSVARTLRGALWQACGGDAVRVAALMDGVRGDDQSGSAAGSSIMSSPFREKRLHQPLSPTVTLASSPTPEPPSTTTPSGTDTESVGNDDTGQMNDHNSDNTRFVEERNIIDTVPTEAPPSLQDPFENFKLHAGAEHHTAYEAAKSSIKKLKALQKSLILSVNAAKGKIDALTLRLTELSEEPIASLRESNQEEESAVREKVSDAKQQYRTQRSELLGVKEQLAAASLDKQQLLKALVQAYEAYSAA